MFEKSLSDLVRGIRAHKANEHQYIAQCMTEIKKELKQENMAVKANAISKLTYLQMMGFDISWAAFNVIEVMSSTKFTYKRIGYLGATQCFHEGLDLVMLTTNMVRKDISAPNQYDASLALNGLACFITPDLARDLANDVLALMSSSKPFLRKKAIFVMYKVFLVFPDALRPAFPRLKDKLEDPDIGVQSAAVSVICELARKNPHNYLSLAPTFFKLMTSSTNNWMLIKIIKLFGALMPLEPRLGKKLIEPLTNLVHSTTAMSLLYECITTVITGLPNHTASIQLCVSKLRLFIEDADQNLKYLGLLAMAKILKAQPKIVQQHKDLIMECLEDRDDSIRLRALDLISGMVSKKNITDIVKKLITHMDTSESASYRDEVLSKIIQICCHNNYQYISNFEWYITVLVEMTKFDGTRHGKQIAAQMLDVTIRVKDVRPFAVRQMATILENTHLFVGNHSEGICEVLYAAAWIVGEFSEHLSDPRVTLDGLLNPKVTALPAHIQAVFVQNIVKLYASILVTAEAEGTSEALEEVGAMLVERLPIFIQSGDLEVQERACCILQLMKYIVKLQGKGAAVADELVGLFAGDLKPVAPNAQKKVPVPEGLDLDKWIYDPPPESEDEQKDDLGFLLGPTSSSGGYSKRGDDHSPTTKKGKKKRSKLEKEEEEEMEKRREERRQNQLSNPHYLKPSSKSSTPARVDEGTGLASRVDVSNIPISKLELGVALVIDDPSLAMPSKKDKRKKKKKRGKKGRRDDSSEDEVVVPRPLVDTSMGEMPEGIDVSDEDKRKKTRPAARDDDFNPLDQNLDAPLRDDEALPVRHHRVVTAPVEDEEEVNQKPSKKDRKKKKRKDKDVAEEADEEESGKKRHKKKKRSKKEQTEGSGSLIDIVEGGEDEPVTGAAEPSVPETKEDEGELNDLEFWLSASKSPGKASTTPERSPKPTKKTKSEAAADVSAVLDEPEEGGKKRRKKGEKKSRKDAKGKKRRTKGGEEEEPAAAVATTTGAELLGLDLETPKQPASTFKLLAEDDNLKMTYETRANMLYNGQVTVAVVFHNLTPHQLVSLDFNVLDSLNTKLERPMGTGSHEGVKLPFQLPTGAANECQFTFYVQSFLVPQKLRGTATYMVKSDAGTTGEKLDFKIILPCSAFICPVPCSQQQLANWLGGGTLCDTQAIKVQYSQTADFSSALSAIVAALHLVVVEKIEDSASLYGSSIANHHICILTKAAGDNGISVNAKGSDSQLVSNLLDEIKAIV